MAFAPIALTIPEYDRTLYANYWLKAYVAGTTTPLAMATDSTGGTTAAKYQLDTQGFPITAGSARLIPYIDGNYDLWLFPTAAEADANNTTNAIQFADNINADPLSTNATRFVASLAELKATALSTTTGVTSNYRTTLGDGGGGDWYADTSDLSTEVTADTLSGIYAAPDSDPTGVSGAWVRKDADILTPQMFGAIADGATVDTAALQGAINAAVTFQKKVRIPEADHLVDETITIPGRVTIYGDNWSSRIVVKSTVGAASDVLAISGTAAITNVRMYNFAIIPESGTPARHAISADITTYAVYGCEFFGLKIEQFGGAGFATLPHATTPLADGFFTSSFDNSYVMGGFYLDQAGDSLRFRNNTVYGDGIGFYVDLVLPAGGTGAHSLLIDGNNITSNGGTLLVKNATSGYFTNNNCEMPTPSGVTNAAMVDLDGDATSIFNGFVVANNFIGNAVVGYDAIRVNYAKKALITGNYVVRALGNFSYLVTANATSTRILNNADQEDALFSAVLSDSGTHTVAVRELGGNYELSTNVMLDINKEFRARDSAGTAIKLLRLSSADNTLQIGTASPTASNGNLLFFVSGSQKGTMTPDGRFAMGGTGATSAMISAESTTKGFLPPKMTTTQKNAIAAPTAGLIVFDTSIAKLCVYNGSVWQAITSA